jgi:rod shape-determining protein MreD
MSFYSNDIYIGKIFPALDFMFVYYWCMFRPKLVSSHFIFSLGLFKDFLMGYPVGLNAVINLILRTVIRRSIKRRRLSFLLFWQGFAMVLAIILLLQWVVFSLIFVTPINVDILMQHYILSVLTYPLMHGLFNLIYPIIPKRKPDVKYP